MNVKMNRYELKRTRSRVDVPCKAETVSASNQHPDPDSRSTLASVKDLSLTLRALIGCIYNWLPSTSSDRLIVALVRQLAAQHRHP